MRAQAALDRTGLEDEAGRQQRRIVLTGQKSAVQDRLRQVEAAEAVSTRLAQLERELVAGLDTVAARKADQERALAALDHATWSAELSSLWSSKRRPCGCRPPVTTSSVARARRQRLLRKPRRTCLRPSRIASRGGGSRSPHSPQPPRRSIASRPRSGICASTAFGARVASLETLDEQRRRHLEAATQKREDASRLEQDAAARELPTAERVAEWREWQAELGAEAPAGRQGLAAWITAALVAAPAGVVVGTAVFLAGLGSTAAVAAALVAAVLAGALVWQLASTRDRAAGTGTERRRLLQEQLAREVQPALRRAEHREPVRARRCQTGARRDEDPGRPATRRGRARRPGGGPTRRPGSPARRVAARTRRRDGRRRAGGSRRPTATARRMRQRHGEGARQAGRRASAARRDAGDAEPGCGHGGVRCARGERPEEGPARTSREGRGCGQGAARRSAAPVRPGPRRPAPDADCGFGPVR